MRTNLFKKIIESGVSEELHTPQKRSIVLTNYLSLVLCGSNLLILVLVPSNLNLSGLLETLIAVIIFSIPILLNALSLTNLSRIYLCWLPPVLITMYMIEGMRETQVVPISTYDGLRFYVLATSCIPYLLMDRKNLLLFIAGIAPSLFIMVFCDDILNFVGVGAAQKAIHLEGYSYTPIRSFIAYAVISGSCLSLRFIIDRSDNTNQRLLKEVQEKNKLIQDQSEEKIRLSEARFRGAFENSAIGMALVSLDGNWFKVNKKLCSMVGYSEEELLTMSFRDITHPDDLNRDISLFTKCMQGEFDTYQVEKRYYHKNGNLLWINLNVALVRSHQGEPLYTVSQIENISDKKNAEIERERTNHLLNERLKELTTLHRASQILQFDSKPTEEIMRDLVTILPAGWQHEEITAARIVAGGLSVTTPNYKTGVHRQVAEFHVPEREPSFIEVVYLEKKPDEFEGPFLEEERRVLDIIAEMLRIYFIRQDEAETLRKSKANLRATINNTVFLMWSVNRKYELINFNKPFEEFIQENYQLPIKSGKRITDNAKDLKSLRDKWSVRYNRALSGELFKTIDQVGDRYIEFSLNPIIEDNRVIGASIFGEDITERKQHENQIAKANKEIGEARLMALRSVMNPHFLFNALNSIQYFIAQNDRQNAINYLSTFSKLMRGVLNSSVQAKIKLSDEITLLRHYVELELVRFENKFRFNIVTPPTLDIEDIEIPSLLIQPFIENAILHGLYNKEGEGILTITLSEDTAGLLVEIEDNGIGREAAWKIRQLNNPGHKSVAMELTEERLKLINDQHNVSYQLVDLYNEQGEACGTKVNIWIR